MKSITLLSKGKTTCEVLSKQLINLLGDKIHINSCYLDGNIKSNITDDLIVISSNPLYDQVKNYLDPKCPFIIAKRSIDYNEIGKLLYINPGTDVLLVNDTKASTDETISILKELGFGYINYFPYYPGIKNPAKLKIAITVGETSIIPQSVERVIDINIRKIDFTTMLDILKKLDLPDAEVNLLSVRFIKDIIVLLKRIKNVSDKNNEIKNELQTILNTVHDGIIAFDTNDTITVYNPIAEKIIGIRSEEKVVRRIGGSKVIPINIRVISATNKNLKELIESGMFRQDLYYRLNVLPLKVPPLRERREDIIGLAKVFYCECLKDNIIFIKADDYFKKIEKNLVTYDWPGNIRELYNVVEYLVIISRDKIPSADLLPEELRSKKCSLENEDSIERRVLMEILSSNISNIPIGRRSLSKKLNISENKVRSIVDIIYKKGFIQIHKGVMGIKLTIQGIREVQTYQK